MNPEDIENSFIANVYFRGKPVVLNYQLMETRLKRPRLTPEQREKYTKSLKYESGFLTVADRPKDEPLLIHFRAEGKHFTLHVATPGQFYGGSLSMENMVDHSQKELSTRNLTVSKASDQTRFNFETEGPDEVRLKSAEKNRLVYWYNDQDIQYFSDTFLPAEHVIYDPTPAVLTLKIRGTGVWTLEDIG